MIALSQTRWQKNLAGHLHMTNRIIAGLWEGVNGHCVTGVESLRAALG